MGSIMGKCLPKGSTANPEVGVRTDEGNGTLVSASMSDPPKSASLPQTTRTALTRRISSAAELGPGPQMSYPSFPTLGGPLQPPPSRLASRPHQRNNPSQTVDINPSAGTVPDFPLLRNDDGSVASNSMSNPANHPQERSRLDKKGVPINSKESQQRERKPARITPAPTHLASKQNYTGIMPRTYRSPLAASSASKPPGRSQLNDRKPSASVVIKAQESNSTATSRSVKLASKGIEFYDEERLPELSITDDVSQTASLPPEGGTPVETNALVDNPSPCTGEPLDNPLQETPAIPDAVEGEPRQLSGAELRAQDKRVHDFLRKPHHFDENGKEVAAPEGKGPASLPKLPFGRRRLPGPDASPSTLSTPIIVGSVALLGVLVAVFARRFTLKRRPAPTTEEPDFDLEAQM